MILAKWGSRIKSLLKKGPLNEEEWMVMKRHPIIARDLLNQIEYLKPSIDIPYCHHEHWNGEGYPQGLSGEDIPLPSPHLLCSRCMGRPALRPALTVRNGKGIKSSTIYSPYPVPIWIRKSQGYFWIVWLRYLPVICKENNRRLS